MTSVRPSAAAPPAEQPQQAPQAQPGSTRFVVLDIMRAVAVVLVIAYHLAPATVPSGFVGVDLFFVLSGFLITRGLLRGIRRERPGTPQAVRGVGGFLGDFYRRRLRRLFPAFAFMLVTVCALALASPADTRVRLGRQVAGALSSTANWVQLATGSSYFDEDTPQLLKHMWSLAVEEQFYLVWPLVLLLLAGAFGGRRRVSLPVAAARFALIAAALSAAGMAVVHLVTGDPDQAHLNTLTHAGGLLLGAFVATMPRPSRPVGSAAGGTAMALGAMAIMALGLVVLRDTSPLPQLGGLFAFSLAAAVVVRWGTTTAAAAQLPGPLLPPVRWLAQRSYALYLWHWPLIVLTRAWLPDHGPGAAQPWLLGSRAVLVLVLSAVAAEASFRVLEAPVQRHGFRGALALAGSRHPRARTLGGALAAALILLTGIAALTAPAQTREQQRLEQLQEQLDSTAPQQRPGPAEEDTASPSAAPRPADPTAPSDPTAEPSRVEPEGVSFIGDSVTVAASPEVLEQHPDAVIDAQVGQQMSTAADTVRRLEAEGRLGRTVVLALGTNGAFSDRELDAAVEAAGPERRFVLVTPYGDRPWIPEAQQVLRDYAKAHPDRVRLAQWDQAAGEVEDMAPDGVHPGPQGAEVWVEAVDRAIRDLDG